VADDFVPVHLLSIPCKTFRDRAGKADYVCVNLGRETYIAFVLASRDAMLDGVFFDFGDTLLPWSATLLKVHRAFTWPTYRRFNASLTFAQLQNALDQADQRFTRFWNRHVEVHTFWLELARQLGISSFTAADAEAFNQEIWQRHLRVVHLFPGVLPLLRWLRRVHVKLAIVSNAWNGVLNMYLDRFALRRLFDFVVTSEDAGALKSELVPFRLALARLDLVPQAVLHVGDRVDEDGACQRLGIHFAWLTIRGTKAVASSAREDAKAYEFRVSSYPALRRTVNRLLAG
jgi:FMN phosphatase YigB (HAD superfamily)